MKRSGTLVALFVLGALTAALALLQGPVGASPGWDLILDRPSPSFAGMDFPSAEEGWLVAGAGLLHSTDGGATWSEAAPLLGLDVDFADPAHGWLVGYNGAIHATTDGGATWRPQDGGTRVHLLDVVAISSTEAWVVGQREGFSDVISFPLPTVLLHTTDGGTTWQHIETPPNSWFKELTFVGQSGWAVGEQCVQNGLGSCTSETRTVVLHTTDGGATWSLPANLPTDARNLTFIDEQHGWVLGTHEFTEGPFPAVFRTSDGGTTWQELPLIAQHFEAYGGLAFRDASNGWLLVRHIKPLPDGVLEIRKTSDGGQTWSSYAVGPSIGFGPSLLVTDSALYITGQNFGAPGLALRSTDGGVTWHQMEHPALVLRAISFVDRSTGFALSGRDLVRSDDAGRTWQRVGPAPDGASLIDFATADIGLALADVCCQGNIGVHVYRTSDGGRTWNETLNTYFSAGSTPLTHPITLQMVDHDHGFFAVDGGFGFTDDGGVSWRTERIGDVGYVYADAADFVDPQHAWAVVTTIVPTHSFQQLIHTDDGGNTWQAVPGLQDPGLRQVDFVDTQHGFYTSTSCLDICQDTIFATSDGGQTWSPVGTGLQRAYPNDLIFVDRLNGWLNSSTCEPAGCRFEVLHTADGGHTWVSQLSGELVQGSFEFVDAQNGWFALDPNRGIGIGGGPPQRTRLYHTTDAGGGPLGIEPTPTIAFPHVGQGARTAGDQPAAWIALAAAIGLAGLAGAIISIRSARRSRPS